MALMKAPHFAMNCRKKRYQACEWCHRLVRPIKANCQRGNGLADDKPVGVRRLLTSSALE
jgi:hypothetical protein